MPRHCTGFLVDIPQSGRSIGKKPEQCGNCANTTPSVKEVTVPGELKRMLNRLHPFGTLNAALSS
jgi:hypothetical protein